MVNPVRCNICHRWFSNNHGLLIHLGFCRQRHDSQQDNSHHQGLEHNPLQSCYDPIDHQNPFALYDDVDESSSGDPSTDEDVPEEAEDDDCSDYGGKNSTDCQFTTSITKIQIRLNDLINLVKGAVDDVTSSFTMVELDLENK